MNSTAPNRSGGVNWRDIAFGGRLLRLHHYYSLGPYPGGSLPRCEPECSVFMAPLRPPLKSCHSGPQRTNRTCAHTKTENITWYEFRGSCQLQDGTLTCIANDVRGPFTMYNFDQWEALPDPNCECP